MHAVLQISGTKPINLLEYVLQNEKMDVRVATQVIEWLYTAKDPKKDWGWVSDERFTGLARRVRTKVWKNRSARECLYFVATCSVGMETVDETVAQLKAGLWDELI